VPTHAERQRFLREYARLIREQRTAFLAAVRLFIAGLAVGSFDPSLRVKRVRGQAGVWELTWANDGRATFEYGQELLPGEPHIIWRRIGTHAIFRQP
jgi:hypothetical protein